MTSRSLGHRAPLLWLVLPMLAGLAVGQAMEAAPVPLLLGALAAAGLALGQSGRPRIWAGALVLALTLAGMASYALHRARLPAWDALPPREARLVLRIDRVFSSPDPKKSAGLATVVRSDEHLRELAGQRVYFSLALKKGEAPPLRTAVVTTIGVLTALLFTYLIVVPIISIVLDAVRVQFGHERRLGKDFGDLTLYYLDRTFTSPVSVDLFWRPLFNTLSVAVGAILLSLLIGTILAWLISRTDMFGRRWFATALIVPYMLPAWTFALAWTTLFKNRTVGGQPGWFEALGWTPPDWVAYGRFPITIILALHYTPFVILLFGSALRRFDSQLEDSARILGAKRYQV
eukprot:gene46051-56373_t